DPVLSSRVPLPDFLACIEDAQRLRLPSAPFPGGGLPVCTGPDFEKKKKIAKNISCLSFYLRQILIQTVKKIVFTLRVTLNRRAFLMANQIAHASTPNTVNFTVARRYLTEREVERLMDTVRKHRRHGHATARRFSPLIAMGCEQAKSATCNGIRSSSMLADCTSTEQRKARPQCIPW